MKAFLVKLRIRIGEYEKSAIHFVRAETEDEAMEEALWGECHNDPKENDQDESGIYDAHGEFYYSVTGCKEVAPEHESILARYLENFWG